MKNTEITYNQKRHLLILFLKTNDCYSLIRNLAKKLRMPVSNMNVENYILTVGLNNAPQDALMDVKRRYDMLLFNTTEYRKEIHYLLKLIDYLWFFTYSEEVLGRKSKSLALEFKTTIKELVEKQKSQDMHFNAYEKNIFEKVIKHFIKYRIYE